MTVLEYHNATRHTPDSIRRAPNWLDWDNMPDPFRHYEGAPLVDLPPDLPPPRATALDVLCGRPAPAVTADPVEFLSQLLFYSASISATKQAPSGQRYALRVNPSSGNLHPTEFHMECESGRYHYRVSSHMLEQRAREDCGPLCFLLTTIPWREAWKYGPRAYRYCLLDAGHAWQALALAARAMGCEARAEGQFPDDEIAASYRLAADESPLLLVRLTGAPKFPAAPDRSCTGGVPNRLSKEILPYPLIESAHAATKVVRHHPVTVEDSCPPPATEGAEARFTEVVRRRRSALDFRGGAGMISSDHFLTLMNLATRPLAADFGSYIQLYAFVHRVTGVMPGAYRYLRDSRRLELVKPGDQRVAAAGLSLHQDLAGNSCFTLSMIADVDRAVADFGDRGYRYVHFEAGAIGQRLYVAAEALGLQSTGIGAFYDDLVHQHLGIASEQGRVVYHFACGYAVADDRLTPP